MKVALVHDYIKEYGGAERVLEALHEVFPDAPVYTSVYLPDYLGPHKDRFQNWNIKTSWLQYIPFAGKLISPFRLLAPFAFRSFDFSGYDVIIVSATGAYSPNILRKQKAVQICYCHTPPRYLYGYQTARSQSNVIIKSLAAIAFHVLRMVDFRSAQHVDHFIANSEEVRKRIEKFYRKDATVLYPPVEIQHSAFSIQRSEQKEYYLAGGRLARPKHIDLIVEACTKLNVPLKVFGKGFAGYGEELKKIAGPTIEFVGEVSDAEKLELMRQAKAYIFASKDEDFGITPIEALSVGTPVIAYHGGGVKETVIDEKTGLFFSPLTVGSLTMALNKFERIKIKPEDCITQAKKFSKERFKKEITDFVAKVASNS